MKFLQRFTHGLAISLMGVMLVLAITSIAAIQPVSDKSTVKTWIEQSGAYSNATDALVDQIDSQEGGETLASQLKDSVLSPDDVYDSARETFDSNFWQTNAEEAIDGVFAWLSGETEQPQFSFGITDQQTQQLTSSIRDRLEQNLAALPACSAQQLATFELERAVCLPSNISAPQAADELNDRLFGEELPLENVSVSGSELEIAPETTDNLQQAYSGAKLAPVVTLGLLVILGLVAFFTARSHINGLRRIGHVFTIGGIFAAIGFYFLGRFVENFEIISSTESAEDAILSQVIQPVAQTAFSDIAQRGIIVSLVFAAVGGTFWGVAYWLHHKDHKPSASASDDTVE